MSLTGERILNNLDWNFKLLAIYALVIVFLQAELSLNPIIYSEGASLRIILIYITGVVYLISLVLIQFDSLKSVSWWISFLYLLILFSIDLFGLSTHQQGINFYMPVGIMLLLLAVSGLFVFFHFPERFCLGHRISQIWFTSHVWYAIAYLTLLYFF